MRSSKLRHSTAISYHMPPQHANPMYTLCCMHTASPSWAPIGDLCFRPSHQVPVVWSHQDAGLLSGATSRGAAAAAWLGPPDHAQHADLHQWRQRRCRACRCLLLERLPLRQASLIAALR